MIDIRIDGEPADLTPAGSLTLERFNPLLDFEAIQGSRVYGFDLPNTPKNRKLLGYFYQPQVEYQSRKYRCEKYVYGQLIEQGFVMIHEVKDEGFNMFYTQNLGEIFGDSQRIVLSELGLGIDSVPMAPVANVNHLTDRYCFPTIQNSGFYGNQAIAGFNGLMNEYTSTGATPGYNANARVPMPFLRWVFNQFSALTGWSFAGQFWQDPDLTRLIFYNLFSLDGQTQINANNHLPALTVPQLLIDLRKLFNLYIECDVRRKVCTMDFSDDVLKNAIVVDWTDKANPKHVKAPELNNRLELSYALDSNDALLKPIPAPLDKYTTAETTLNEGGSLVSIQSRVSTLATDAQTGRAMTQQPGLSPSNKDSKNDSIPKLLFYNGLVNGEPRASSAHGNRSLTLHGDRNLVDGYKEFEAFKGNTFSVTKLVYLTAADLALFSFRNQVHIKGVNYVVGSMKAVLSNNQNTIPTEVKLWKK
ncbi:hypothetical protein M0L20_13505 [Spirosoma sp. RP8]|uniref:Virion structural protein n=1 Tax=Spirosoma liriopis TaxID=2937440 RepID=A0ABT0HMJ9_9BACT|nr:hypothetical protein [Spirosoma liriopis]MCK8492878.1 hypothetical protein [Spirosoma liriopis]